MGARLMRLQRSEGSKTGRELLGIVDRSNHYGAYAK